MQESSSRKPGPVIGAVILAFITVYAFGKYVRHAYESAFRVSPTALVTPVPLASLAPSVAPSASAPKKHARFDREKSWDRFRTQWGPQLVPLFDRTGRLISVRGRVGEGQSASGDFKVNDPQKVIARAREVIEAAHELLDLRGGLPLLVPVTKATPNSAQVFLQESKNGIPLAPLGSVMVDLGPQGELLGLNSDYVSELQLGNETQLTPEQGKAAAVAVVNEPSVLKPEGGALVIWVERPAPGAVAQGMYAYRYNVKGRDIVVDAANGRILHERDQRRQ